MNLSAKTIGISAGVLVFMVISYFIISGTFNIAHYFNTNILFRQITDWCSWENGGYIALFILLYLGALIGLVLILGLTIIWQIHWKIPRECILSYTLPI